MFSPRGERVGCFVTTLTGIYPFTRVYGEDVASGIPGMRAGEAVTFRVNGATATTVPATALWQNDLTGHPVDLSASSSLDVGAILASIAGKYSLLLGQEGTYAPPPADPRFNTLNTLAVGQGYLIRMTQAGEIVLNGSLAADMALNLAVGWNWIGYLPTNPLPVATALASIAGKYSLLLAQDGTFAPPPADPRFNTLAQMAAGAGYMIRMTQAATLVYPR
jgi:hypothetical protein